MRKLTFSDIEAKVAKEPMSGCWLWLGNVNKGGYGTAKRGSLAHRVSYELAGNEIPDGQDVMHLCHNRCCVNPAHLQAGSRKENVQMSVDADRWSNQLRSEARKKHLDSRRKNGFIEGYNRRLNDEQVMLIRSTGHTAEQRNSLANEFGISPTAIRAIYNRKAYKYVV